MRAETVCCVQENSDPKRRLSDVFSERSIQAQRPGRTPEQPTPGSNLLTPQGATPTSQLGVPHTAPRPALVPASMLNSQGRTLPRDLLTGSPAGFARLSTPEQQVLSCLCM